MPPEMITIVAPTAMMAKKLASVAVWISVYEFRKLLMLSPVTRSGCDPAKRVRSTPRLTMTRSRPACAELKKRLTIDWATRSVAGLIAFCAVELEGQSFAWPRHTAGTKRPSNLLNPHLAAAGST